MQAVIQASQASPDRLPRVAGNSTLAEVEKTLGSPSSPGPRYELHEEIGRGGMGVVWRARDHDLNREVAFKVLRAEYEISPAAIRRFVTESQIAGRLQHSGIVPVYELGSYPDGRVYLVMKLVRGRTLTQWAQSNPTFAERVSVFASVCQTMAFAHAEWVLHRDLKPSNIMLSHAGEVLVMDWGLGKHLHQVEEIGPITKETRFDSETAAGAILGTPGYLAQEHLAGNLAPWAKTSDVYSLGVILLELLTGKALQEVSNLNRESVVTELRVIVDKCLATQPQSRWSDAGELAKAIAAYQATVESRLNEAILARHTAELRVEAERKRRRLWLAWIGTAALATAVVTGIVLRNRLQEFARRAAETQRLLDADRSVRELLTEADSLLAKGQHGPARAIIGKAEGLASGGASGASVAIQQRNADVVMLEQLESIRLKRSYGKPLNATRNPLSDKVGVIYDRGAAE